MSGPLDGHVAIVTGAGRGIGAAIARRLARDGAAVCVADLDPEPAEETAAAIRAAGGRARAAKVDVSRRDEVVAAAEQTAAEYGDLTLLVNNAGITRHALVHKLDDAEWDLHQDVILRGTLHGFQAVAPWFRDRERRKPRRVVNISSVAATHGGLAAAAYSAAKAGVIGLTRTMAVEWAPYGVTVNAIAPGFIATRMTAARDESGGEGMLPEVRERVIARIPVGRAGTPDDIAAAAAFFCAPDAGFVTGQVLEVSGGMADMNT